MNLPQGKYYDIVTTDGGGHIDYGWRSNLVVDQCRELLAAFVIGGPASGIHHLALGQGNAVWDTAPPASPATGNTMLTDFSPVIIPVADLQLDYLDTVGDPSSTPSHRIQITLTLTSGALPISGDEVYALREFGLFGRLDGSDRMIDYVRHPVMNIGVGDTLTRRIRLVF